MKNEALYIQDLSFFFSDTRKLENLSLALLEGEGTGFWGIAGSGKDALMNVLCAEEWPQSGKIFVGGRYIANAAEMARNIYRINPVNYSFAEWTLFIR